jgi:signal transduction histidine kinase
LLAETELTAEQREYVDMIEVCGDRLLTVLNNVLDFSKVRVASFSAHSIQIEATKLTLNESPFCLADCIETIVELFQEKHKAKLTCSIDTDVDQYIVADAGRLRQIVSNLISNAHK